MACVAAPLAVEVDVGVAAAVSREHFSVDGTLLEATAALKSLRPIDEGEGD